MTPPPPQQRKVQLKNDSDQFEIFFQVLKKLLKNSYDQSVALKTIQLQLAEINNDEENETKNKKSKTEITTVVALVVFALTILALILAKCSPEAAASILGVSP